MLHVGNYAFPFSNSMEYSRLFYANGIIAEVAIGIVQVRSQTNIAKEQNYNQDAAQKRHVECRPSIHGNTSVIRNTWSVIGPLSEGIKAVPACTGNRCCVASIPVAKGIRNPVVGSW